MNVNNNNIEKIYSIYIFETIFSYLKNSNYKFILFKYSKLFQKKLKFNYIERYLDSIHFIDKLFSFKNLYQTELTDNIIYEIGINKIEKYLLNYFRKYKKQKFPIGIDSVFFDIIMKNDYLKNIFYIKIPINEFIDNKNYRRGYYNKYNNVFEKMNKSNIKYTSLLFYYKIKINEKILNEIKIDFNQIKELSIQQEFYNSNYYDNEVIEEEKNNIFYQNLFSVINIQKNIIYLDLCNKVYFMIEKNSFQNLNNFKSLLILKLNHFIFKSTFILEIKTLQIINLTECQNIELTENGCLHLKELNLINCIISKPKSLLNCPLLEKLNLNTEEKYHNIINFKSLINLKEITSSPIDFISLKNTLLESATIYNRNMKYSYKETKLMIEQLCSIKSLKKIEFSINKLINYDLSKISEKNTSVENMIIHFTKEDDENQISNLINLQNLFPNITNLNLFIDSNCYYNTYIKNPDNVLEIKEKEKCKINKLYINIFSNSFNIKLYCQPFEKLKEVKFHLHNQINNIENIFPIFQDYIKNKKKNIIFKSLASFELIIENCGQENNKEINIIIENIFKNIDITPNLQIFKIEGIAYIKEDYYKKYIRKILSLNLNIIDIYIRKKINSKYEFYSSKELKEIYPKTNYDNYNEIIISKF